MTPREELEALRRMAELQRRAAPAAAAPAPPAARAPDPTEGMGWGEKALVNVGAGIDTAWQGAKGLVGQGMSDEELEEKRRIDKDLAERTTGGGALQFAGEILPTIPLGMGAGALARGAGGLAARAAASPTVSSALGGATSGALMPVTEDESRLTNIGLGAAGGAVAPHLLKGAMKLGRGGGQVAQRVGAALPGAVGERAARAAGGRKTAEHLQRELGDRPLPAQDVYTPHPFLEAEGVRPSAATAMQDPRVVSLERGSRTKAGENWMDFDEAAQVGRYKVLDEGLQKQSDLDALLTKANAIGADVENVYKAAPAKKFNQEMTDFYDLIKTTKTTAEYHGKPTVRAAVDYIENTMKGAGVVTPKLLHMMKQTVAGGLKGVPGIGDEGVRATASEPFVRSLTEAMDRVLDKSTKGKYGSWKGAYAHQMTKAEGAKADINIRAKFMDPATGVMRKAATGVDGSPIIQAQALKQAIASAGSMKRGPRKGKNVLDPGSQDVLQALVRDLDAQAIAQRSKGSSTAGGGSDTASNFMQAAVMEGFLPSGLGMGTYVVKEGKRKIEKSMQDQLAEILQDPQKLRAVLARAEQQRLLRGQTPDLLPGVGAAAPLLLGGSRE